MGESINERLEFNESYPIGVSYRFRNITQRTADGSTQNIIAWNQPLASYDLSKIFFYGYELDYLVDFFNRVEGRAIAFRYSDPVDNYCTASPYDTGLGAITQGVLLPKPGGGIELAKKYQIGDASLIRPITRAVTETITLYESELTWQGSFDVLVRFENDALPTTILSEDEEGNELYGLPGLKLVEVREEPEIYPPPTVPSSLNHEFSLYARIERQTALQAETKISSFDSGWERRDTLRETAMFGYTLPEQGILYAPEIEYLVSLYRITRGGIPFRYESTPVFFSGELNINATAIDTYSASSIQLTEYKESFDLLGFLDSETYIKILIDSSGSMYSYKDPVIEAAESLRESIKENIFGGDEARTAKYFKGHELRGGERWIEWLAEDLRDSPDEPDKVLFLIWVNEAEPHYHGNFNNPSIAEPTSQFVSGLNIFLSSYQARDKFKAILYAVEGIGSSLEYFDRHVERAHKGIDGYPIALKNYGLTIKLDVSNTTTTENYIADLLGSNTTPSLKNFNTLCRCWTADSLGFLDSETYIKIFIDASPSMYPYKDPVIEAAESLRESIKNIIFGGDEARTNKYYKGYELRGDEVWLQWLTEDLRDSPDEPDKVIFLVWVNESEPHYHPATLAQASNEPTVTFINHLDSFLASHAQREKFKAVVYAVETDQEAGRVFDRHITDAYNGTNGYTVALKNYCVRIKLDVPNTKTAEDYIAEIVGINSSLTGIINSSCKQIGFTDHDEPVNIDGTTCYPNYGGSANSIQYTNEAAVDNSEAKFALSSELIKESDLLGGKYEKTLFKAYAVNWVDPSQNIRIFNGFFGKFTIIGGRNEGYEFSAESRSLMSLLQQQNTIVTTMLCPYQFGDQNCALNLNNAGLVDNLTVSSVLNNKIFSVTGNARMQNFYGEITFLSGANAQYSRLVASYSNGQFVLWQPLPFSPAIGDTFQAKARCAKTGEACESYGNKINFGGFQNIPGTDTLLKGGRGERREE